MVGWKTKLVGEQGVEVRGGRLRPEGVGGGGCRSLVSSEGPCGEALSKGPTNPGPGSQRAPSEGPVNGQGVLGRREGRIKEAS